MRRVLLLVVPVLAVASSAAAQSCATLGGGLDCRVVPAKPPANPPAPAAGHHVEVLEHAETTISNHGVSTTLNNRVIDSHGMIEFGFSASTGAPCRSGPYRTPCE